MQPSGNIEKWLDDEAPLYPTKHNPCGAPYRFDERAVCALVLSWQADQRTELMDKILLLAHPVITGVVLTRGAHTVDMEETLHHLRIKIWRKLSNYNCSKGRLYTYLTMVAHQTLDELQARQRRYQERYAMTDVAVLESTPYSTAPEIRRTEILADIKWRLYQTRTVCTDPHELESQRWLVRGLLDSGFGLRRHEAADATVMVYGLHPRRARVLHDQTMLEVRRQLLDVVKVPAITRRDLIGTRGHALAKYSDQLSAQDFSKLAYLMKNLAPAIIPRPERVDLILGGFPNAQLLFKEQLNNDA